MDEKTFEISQITEELIVEHDTNEDKEDEILEEVSNRMSIQACPSEECNSSRGLFEVKVEKSKLRKSKFETDMDSETLEAEDVTAELLLKKCDAITISGIVLNRDRIKDEFSSNGENGCEARNKEASWIQTKKLQSEMDMYSAEFEVTSELIIKDEGDASTTQNLEIVKNGIRDPQKEEQETRGKFYSNVAARKAKEIMVNVERMNIEMYMDLKKTEDKATNKYDCSQCGAPLKSKVARDNHVLKKHPNFIASVTYKIHECNICTFKTTYKKDLIRHILSHSGAITNHKSIPCVHCKTIFKSKPSLDDHILKKHTNFIESVTSKIHECTQCTYKTTSNGDLHRHLLNHPELKSNYKFRRCEHCNASFKKKNQLDNHVLKKHPSFTASVTCKTYECTICNYKTTQKGESDRHALKHPETRSNFNKFTCIDCTASYVCKSMLNDHILKHHPNLLDLVKSKVHGCTTCNFKTTRKFKLARHMLNDHPDTTSCFKFNTCPHCNKTFVSKKILDNHIIRIHTEFIDSVTSSIYKCTLCTYQTTVKSYLDIHTRTHSNSELSTCPHCNTSFKNKYSMNEHIIKKHPNFFESVTYKKYICAKCNYKTIYRNNFLRHVESHLDTSSRQRFKCRYCDATFKGKITFSSHILRKHPKFAASLKCKVHECPMCSFKTVNIIDFRRHIRLQHPEKVNSYRFIVCEHCNAAFESTSKMDEHILNEHPKFIASITTKFYECKKCSYKTICKGYIDRHILKHQRESRFI